MPKTAVAEEHTIDCADSLALFIALEIRKGADSRIADYFAFLPKSFDYQLHNWPDKFDSFMSDQILYEKKLARSGLKSGCENEPVLDFVLIIISM